MPGPTGELDPPTFVGALRFRGTGFEVWAGTNEGRLFGGPGAPTWAQVLASGRVTGGVGNNPHIDSGDILSFGDSGSLPVTGTIRSSTDIEMRAAGGLELTSDATMQLQAIGSIPIRLVTNATERLRIGGDGAWRIDGDEGTAGQILTSNGPGATPTWEDAPGGGAQGWDDVLAVDNNSGANNPHIDTGQFIGFGVEGSLPGSGQLRSSADWAANITGAASVVGSVSVSVTGGGNGMAATSAVASLGAGTTGMLAFTSTSMQLRTNNVARLTLGTAGGWTINATEGSAGQYIRSAGAGAPPTWATISISEVSGTFALTDGDKGDITVSSSGTVWTIGNNAVSNAAIRDGGACSVIGRSANSSGDPADISAGTNNQFLRRVSNVLGFGDPASASVINNGGSFERAALTGAIAAGQNSNSTFFTGFRVNGVGQASARPAANFLSTTSIIPAQADDAGGDEVEFTFQRAALTGDVTASQNSNATTIANNAVTNAKADDMAAHTVKVRVGGTTGDPSDLAIGTDSFLSRIGSANLASHGFSTLAGNGMSYSAGTLTIGAGTGITVAATTVAVNTGANFTWTGVHSFTGSSHTINVTGAVAIDADATSNFTTSVGNITVETTAGSGLANLVSRGGAAGGSGANIQLGGAINLDVSNFLRISTGNPLTERLEIQSDGAWQVSGDTGSLGGALLSQGSSSPPIWGDRADVSDTNIVAAGTSAFSTIVTLTIPANTLVVGSTYELYAHCKYVRSGSPATAHNVQMRAEANGAAMGLDLTVASGTQNSNTSDVIYYGTFTCLTTGASGTAVATLAIDQNIPLGTNALSRNAGTSGAGTINTTASNTIRLRVDFSANVTGARFDCSRAWIRRIA